MAACLKSALISCAVVLLGSPFAIAQTDFECASDFSCDRSLVGAPIRLVCFKSEIAGDHATKDENFMIIVQQTGGMEKFDARDFSRRHSAERKSSVSEKGIFDIYVVRDVAELNAPDSDFETIAEFVVSERAGLEPWYSNVEGQRLRKALKVRLQDDRGWVMWSPNRPSQTDFRDFDIRNSPIDGFLINLACHVPFGMTSQGEKS